MINFKTANYFRNYLSHDQRLKNYCNQVFGSLLWRAISITLSYLAVPLLLTSIGNDQYGLWAVFLSFFSLVAVFDGGIGNGLRNRVTHLCAQNEITFARQLISSTYTIGLIWFLFLCSVIFLLADTVYIYGFLNVRAISYLEFDLSFKLLVVFIFLNLWFSIGISVCSAMQRSSWVVMSQAMTNSSFYFFCFFFSEKILNFSDLVLVYGLALSLSNFVLNLFLFYNFSFLSPYLRFSFKDFRSVINTGIKFLIIQIAGVVIFSTDRILISHVSGPEYVSEYDVAIKLFIVLQIMHGLIASPMWSAYSDAYATQNFVWLRSNLKRQLYIWVSFIPIGLLMVFLGDVLLDFWLGSVIVLNHSLLITTFIFIILSMFGNVLATFVNGIGIINVQMVFAIVAMIINIPLSIHFGKSMNLGAEGVILASIVSLSLPIAAMFIQITFILKSWRKN